MPAFPDASFTDVVRPNADTLYSTLWYDVSRDPLLISVPDSRGRYYLLPMLDMWTDVFAAPGARTSGTAPQIIALVGPRWQGALPEGVQLIRSPTAMGWIIGRTQTNGPDDYDHVHHFQDGLRAVSLGALSSDPAVPMNAYLVDPTTGRCRRSIGSRASAPRISSPCSATSPATTRPIPATIRC